MITLLLLTCSLRHHQLGFAAGTVSFGGVGGHSDGVRGVRLQAPDDHLLCLMDMKREVSTMLGTDKKKKKDFTTCHLQSAVLFLFLKEY